MLFKKIFTCLIIYSLNLALCLHLAISSFLLFSNIFGSGKSKMWIFFSRHRLHLLSKDFGVLDLFNIQFDIIDFYPSITKNILIDSINYARKYIDITIEQYEIILACRKTVLKSNDSTWVKNGLDNFDVPMGGV